VKPEMQYRDSAERSAITTPSIDQHVIPNNAPTLNVLIQMKNDNKSDYTINFARKALNFLAKHTSLNEPETVKHFIAQLKTSNSYKRNLCIAYNKYCKFYKIEWTMPLYLPEAKNIKLPTKEKLLMLIAKARIPTSIKLNLSMETGLRPVELCRLKVNDIDLEHRVVNPITAKKGNPRTLKISQQLTASIHEWIIKNNLNLNDKLFKGDAEDYGKYYRAMRNKLAKDLKDPSIHTIRLYDFRHYFCSKQLNDTKDPYFVIIQMGHKKLETTQKYMHLMNLNDDEWTCKTASTVEEVTQLVEAGFQYVTEMDGLKIFKKRK
jgi:integrase